jgi:hypothetical protein
MDTIAAGRRERWRTAGREMAADGGDGGRPSEEIAAGHRREKG